MGLLTDDRRTISEGLLAVSLEIARVAIAMVVSINTVRVSLYKVQLKESLYTNIFGYLGRCCWGFAVQLPSMWGRKQTW